MMIYQFQSQYTKSNTALNAHNATLLAAAGVDARLLSQMGNFNSNNITSNSKRSTESPVHQKKETPETQQQRQAAAKLALRKQLEKTLLQVQHNMTSFLTYSTHGNFSRSRCYLSDGVNNINICRFRHPNLLRQKCILSRTPPTRSSSTCAASRSACRGSWTWTPRPRPNPCPSSARSAAPTSRPRGSGIRRPKVGTVINRSLQSFFAKFYCCLIIRHDPQSSHWTDCQYFT